ncbi:MAG: 5'-nucleotidase, lipoprotein e(P4) family [Alphaproteobacteria bacterium]
MKKRLFLAVAGGVVALLTTVGASTHSYAQAVPTNDNLNAALWTQKSVEFKANTLGEFALARIRLDQALKDKNWTAAPAEQKGAFQKLPPAIVVDVDETVLDNSRYQTWMVLNDKSFSGDTWTKFCQAQVSEAVPGAVDFLKYADSKGVKVFYVSNRNADVEDASRQNMQRFGFPMGGNVDTFFFAKKRPEWTSDKGIRRAVIAKDYRILLNIGDNFGDFVDNYKGTEAERLKVMEENKAHWGHDWIMIANPTYGSWESTPFGNNFKLPADEQRKAKRGALDAWNGN